MAALLTQLNNMLEPWDSLGDVPSNDANGSSSRHADPEGDAEGGAIPVSFCFAESNRRALAGDARSCLTKLELSRGALALFASNSGAYRPILVKLLSFLFQYLDFLVEERADYLFGAVPSHARSRNAGTGAEGTALNSNGDTAEGALLLPKEGDENYDVVADSFAKVKYIEERMSLLVEESSAQRDRYKAQIQNLESERNNLGSLLKHQMELTELALGNKVYTSESGGERDTNYVKTLVARAERQRLVEALEEENHLLRKEHAEIQEKVNSLLKLNTEYAHQAIALAARIALMQRHNIALATDVQLYQRDLTKVNGRVGKLMKDLGSSHEMLFLLLDAKKKSVLLGSAEEGRGNGLRPLKGNPSMLSALNNGITSSAAVVSNLAMGVAGPGAFRQNSMFAPEKARASGDSTETGEDQLSVSLTNNMGVGMSMNLGRGSRELSEAELKYRSKSLNAANTTLLTRRTTAGPGNKEKVEYVLVKNKPKDRLEEEIDNIDDLGLKLELQEMLLVPPEDKSGPTGPKNNRFFNNNNNNNNEDLKSLADANLNTNAASNSASTRGALLDLLKLKNTSRREYRKVFFALDDDDSVTGKPSSAESPADDTQETKKQQDAAKQGFMLSTKASAGGDAKTQPVVKDNKNVSSILTGEVRDHYYLVPYGVHRPRVPFHLRTPLFYPSSGDGEGTTSGLSREHLGGTFLSYFSLHPVVAEALIFEILSQRLDLEAYSTLQSYYAQSESEVKNNRNNGGNERDEPFEMFGSSPGRRAFRGSGDVGVGMGTRLSFSNTATVLSKSNRFRALLHTNSQEDMELHNDNYYYYSQVMPFDEFVSLFVSVVFLHNEEKLMPFLPPSIQEQLQTQKQNMNAHASGTSKEATKSAAPAVQPGGLHHNEDISLLYCLHYLHQRPPDSFFFFNPQADGGVSRKGREFVLALDSASRASNSYFLSYAYGLVSRREVSEVILDVLVRERNVFLCLCELAERERTAQVKAWTESQRQRALERRRQQQQLRQLAQQPEEKETERQRLTAEEEAEEAKKASAIATSEKKKKKAATPTSTSKSKKGGKKSRRSSAASSAAAEDSFPHLSAADEEPPLQGALPLVQLCRVLSALFPHYTAGMLEELMLAAVEDGTDSSVNPLIVYYNALLPLRVLPGSGNVNSSSPPDYQSKDTTTSAAADADDGETLFHKVNPFSNLFYLYIAQDALFSIRLLEDCLYETFGVTAASSGVGGGGGEGSGGDGVMVSLRQVLTYGLHALPFTERQRWGAALRGSITLFFENYDHAGAAAKVSHAPSTDTNGYNKMVTLAGFAEAVDADSSSGNVSPRSVGLASAAAEDSPAELKVPLAQLLEFVRYNFLLRRGPLSPTSGDVVTQSGNGINGNEGTISPRAQTPNSATTLASPLEAGWNPAHVRYIDTLNERWERGVMRNNGVVNINTINGGSLTDEEKEESRQMELLYRLQGNYSVFKHFLHLTDSQREEHVVWSTNRIILFNHRVSRDSSERMRVLDGKSTRVLPVTRPERTVQVRPS